MTPSTRKRALPSQDWGERPSVNLTKAHTTTHLLFILYDSSEFLPRLSSSACDYGRFANCDVKTSPEKAIDGCCRMCDMISFAFPEAACHVDEDPLIQMT